MNVQDLEPGFSDGVLPWITPEWSDLQILRWRRWNLRWARVRRDRRDRWMPNAVLTEDHGVSLTGIVAAAFQSTSHISLCSRRWWIQFNLIRMQHPQLWALASIRSGFGILVLLWMILQWPNCLVVKYWKEWLRKWTIWVRWVLVIWWLWNRWNNGKRRASWRSKWSLVGGSTVDTVRSRIVIKDIAQKGGESARSLGISSPTPSADAFMLVVGLAAAYDFVIMSSDVAHAFMATPLRVRDVVIRLPLSVSTMSGVPLFLHLSKARNGLRKASQDWMAFLSDIVKGIGTGLSSCNLEPCLFTGRLKSGPCCLLVYVDDLLLMTPTVEDAEKIFDAIGKHVDLKRTGLLRTSKAGGGSLRFLGRVIARQKGESSILVSLPPDYLESRWYFQGLRFVWQRFNSSSWRCSSCWKRRRRAIFTGSFSWFRSALGKVAWMSQTRQDLRAYIAILACQQASPTNFTEHGLRALLRFLQTDMSVVARLPASSDVLKPTELFGENPHMICFSDASHAPLRATKRRGISGGVLSVFGFVVKLSADTNKWFPFRQWKANFLPFKQVRKRWVVLGNSLDASSCPLVSLECQSFQVFCLVIQSQVSNSCEILISLGAHVAWKSVWNGWKLVWLMVCWFLSSRKELRIPVICWRSVWVVQLSVSTALHLALRLLVLLLQVWPRSPGLLCLSESNFVLRTLVEVPKSLCVGVY